MKILILFGATLVWLTTSFVSFQDNKDRCKTIVDSANAFIQTSEFGINIKPTIQDNERNLRLDRWLQKLSFGDLRCLLDNENISIKVTGYTYAAISNGDSLLKFYSYLLADTTTVQFFMINGNKSPKMKLGELLSTMTQKIQEDNDNFAKRPEIEQIVSIFIKDYSTYPNTYKPYSFPYFSMDSDNEELTDFRISHEYEIKNNEGKIVKVVSAFVFDKRLKLTVIEKDSTSCISAYPPKLGYWLKEFGRKLTKLDSLNLRLQ